MKENGSKTHEKAKGSRDILIETHIMDNSNMAEHMAKGSIPGIMVKFMMASGTKGLNKDMEY